MTYELCAMTVIARRVHSAAWRGFFINSKKHEAVQSTWALAPAEARAREIQFPRIEFGLSLRSKLNFGTLCGSSVLRSLRAGHEFIDLKTTIGALPPNGLRSEQIEFGL